MSISRGNSLFCAYRSEIGADFDIIGFESYQDMIDFCDFNQEYLPFETGLYSLKDAKEIFA